MVINSVHLFVASAPHLVVSTTRHNLYNIDLYISFVNTFSIYTRILLGNKNLSLSVRRVFFIVVVENKVSLYLSFRHSLNVLLSC